MTRTFAELVLRPPDTRPYALWTLQEIQNTVSYALDLPLRIVVGPL